ncbi:MAG: prolyl oligopeptidase family serine peptidase [Lachnospiraceae bacterium]|nr:prolyl oligopeptidase family serine peptidase [Lachnospiraceae bacterium]
MKKWKQFGISCVAALFAMSTTAFAQVQFSSNESSFETFEEASVNGPEAMAAELGGNYISDPCLEEYPEGTTYIYRSAARWSATSAGYRSNTVLQVYTDEKFESKDEAQAYLESLGLVDIIEEAKGSIILVNPIGESFSKEDARAYYLMQTATCNLGGTVTEGEEKFTCAEGAYYGGLTYRYVIGIGDGATFINNYIAPTFDDVTRVAGMILIDGKMDRIHDVAGVVPVYMVNPSETALAKYQEANDTNRHGYVKDVDIYFSQEMEQQKVMVKNTEQVDLAAEINYGYYNLLIKNMRLPVVLSGLHTYSQEYTDHNWNAAPYSLSERNAFFDYTTDDGLVIEEFTGMDTFKDYNIKEGTIGLFGREARTGAYIDTWYEVVPEEVKDGTAPEHSVPMWLALHGGGDDPLQFLDEMGFMTLAGEERFAMIAPIHGEMFTVGFDVLPAVVEYFLDKYPSLDPSRVYVTGYSMGGGATLHAINGNAKYFAAACPNAAAIFNTDDEIVNTDDLDLPILFTTATYDFCGFGGISGHAAVPNPDDPYDPEHINTSYQNRINDYLTLNGIENITYDFETYPMSGFRADEYTETFLNNEYMSRTWYLYNDQDVPMVGLNITDYLPHGLYQQFGKICWDYAKHFSRNQETGEVVYNPYVK